MGKNGSDDSSILRLKHSIWRLLALLCVLAVLAGVTFAWLIREDKTQGYVSMSDFQVEALAYFGDSKEPERVEEGLLSVSLDPSDPNYIGSLKLYVRYTGISPAYLRVRILEQTTDAEGVILASGMTPYRVLTKEAAATLADVQGQNKTINTASLLENGRYWIDNRKEDNCYYWNGIFQPEETSANADGLIEYQGNYTEVLLIDGLTREVTAQPGVRMQVLFEVEAVQPNRVEEFWNLDQQKLKDLGFVS